MKPLLSEFFCLAPLRSGCYIIAIFKITMSTSFLFGYFSRMHLDNPEINNEKRMEEYLFHEQGSWLSLGACAFNYIIAAVIFVGVYKLFLGVILLSSILLFVDSVFHFASAIFAHYNDQTITCIALSIYSVLIVYFAVIVLSYYMEAKEEEMFWAAMDGALAAELQEERVQAKQQGLPDPMKAALKKYRAPVEEETPPVKKPANQPTEPKPENVVTEKMTGQPNTSSSDF